MLDGVGIGAQPDAHRYGDEAADTLGHVCRDAAPKLPNLERLGLGRIKPLNGIEAVRAPTAAFGKMREASAGKDSTTGHWELAGIRLHRAFPTYPEGFPPELIERFVEVTGCDAVLANKPASGTAIISEFGAEHQRTGHPIVYTSADSVLQVAAHKDTLPLEELYDICRRVRQRVCVGDHAVGRVIARPFIGRPGTFQRVSEQRKDFSLPPPATTVQEVLRERGVHTTGIGKIGDLFAGIGFDDVCTTTSNAGGLSETLHRMQAIDRPAFIWTNLVDFDQEFGHRNDPTGFAAALEAFDAAVPGLIDALPEGGRLVITADHGNDPTTPSTDHSREFVPLLVYGGPAGITLGVRASFCDHAASLAAYFGVPFEIDAQAFEEDS